MEAFEAAKIVYNRILETESETITRKIIGYIYLQDHADREMIRLAFGPDNLIQTLIQKAKMDLNLSPKPVPSPLGQILHSHRPFSAPQMVHYPNMVHDHFIGVNDHFEPLSPNISYSENCYSSDGNFRTRKICHYFNKGHCKHGNSCKFIHSQSMPDFNYEIEDQAAFSSGSLEKLEFEITEILKSRRGNPISIASLPMIYYERYGKTLQAEGYLTESQRHGKAGYSLTRLLARLKNSIRLIDRPHGQHAVVLADDVSRYLENSYERNIMNPGPIVTGSKQIYLTFPAESIFTEDDVANYFSTYGPVQDVRIPCQQKRMFGFVTFHDSETVQMILSKGNPHFVCGARVLVKPYREKLKLFDRKYFDKLDTPMCYHSHHMDMDQDLQSRFESSRSFDRQLAEEHELAIQLEMMRLSQLHLTRAPSYLENTFDDQKPSDEADNSNYQSPKLVTRLLDHDSESNEGLDLNLPDSPFACNKGSIKQM